MTDHGIADAWKGASEKVVDWAGDAADAAKEHAPNAARAAREKLSSTAAAAKDRVDDGVRTVTLQNYRDEIDQTLAQVVEVLVAHETELRYLRARVQKLEDALDSKLQSHVAQA